MANRIGASTRNTAINRPSSNGGRATVSAPRRNGSSVVFNDSGRTRSNFGNSGRTFTNRNDGRNNGRGSSGFGVVTLSDNTNNLRDRHASGRRGGRRFNSGHGSTGAPFAGSFFINNNVSRYGRAYDRSDIFHDGHAGRSVGLYANDFSGHSSGFGAFRGGHGHHRGRDSYRHAYGHGSYFDNAYYFSSSYYGRRHHRGYHRDYDSVYYPAFGYYGYGVGYPYAYPLTYVGVSTQDYYEVDPAIEDVYEEVITAPDTGTVYVQPAPSVQAAPVPSTPLSAPSPNQASPQVGQISIPQSVVDGHQAFARHDLVKARHAYLNAVLADGGDGYAKLFYAMASMAAGEYDVASLALRGALRSAPELVTDPIDLRQFYNNEDQVKTDIEALSTFTSLHVNDLESQFLLVYFRYAMGQADEAQRALMSVDSAVIENDATMKELRDAVGAVISRSQDQSEQDQP